MMTKNSIEIFNQGFSVNDWKSILQSLNCKYMGNNYFQRAGKSDSSKSMGLQNTNNIWFLKVFSDNSGFAKTTNGKDYYSPFEFLLQNKYNGDFKEAINDLQLNTSFTGTRTASNNSFTAQRTIEPPKKKEPITIEHDKELSYRWYDADIKAEQIDLMFEQKLTQAQADKLLISKYPNKDRVREYCVMVNRSVVNKNLNPITKEIHRTANGENFHFLTYHYERFKLTLDEILNAVSGGYSILPIWLKDKKEIDGKQLFQRVNSNFFFSELIMLDVDRDIKIDEILEANVKGLIAIYTTTNHTDELHKFRMIIELPFRITNGKDYTRTLENYISQYKTDIACKDCSRAFYGNYNATVYNLVSGEQSKYLDGVKL